MLLRIAVVKPFVDKRTKKPGRGQSLGLSVAGTGALESKDCPPGPWPVAVEGPAYAEQFDQTVQPSF